MEFLLEYGWIIVLLVLAIVMYVIRFKMVGEKQATIELRETAYRLMLMAEKRFSDGQGKLKMDFVLDRFYPALPNTMKILIRKQDLEVMLQSFYDDLKDFLDDGQLNNK